MEYFVSCCRIYKIIKSNRSDELANQKKRQNVGESSRAEEDPVEQPKSKKRKKRKMMSL